MPSAPVKTDESVKSGRPPLCVGSGGLPAPAPPSQPLDGGAGAGICFLDRRDTIVKLAEEYWGAIDARFELRALTLAEAGAEFRAQLSGEMPRVPSPDLDPPRVTKPATLEGALISYREIELLKHFLQEALGIIQNVRHAVRAGRPVASEPPYPKTMDAAAMVLHRLR